MVIDTPFRPFAFTVFSKVSSVSCLRKISDKFAIVVVFWFVK
jgi:hypothetical protein